MLKLNEPGWHQSQWQNSLQLAKQAKLTILFKNKNAYFKKKKFTGFISGVNRCMALYFSMTMPDPILHAHTTQFLADNNIQILPGFPCPQM